MSASFRNLFAAVVLCTLSGCLAHQRQHSVVRIWADWNTYAQCSLCMEELDHKPLRAARVGAFIWAYDKDPGHQAAYAKARLEWEALVAQRLQQATNAANGVGPPISNQASCPVQTNPSDTKAPPAPDSQLPPLPQASPNGDPPPAPPVPPGPDEVKSVAPPANELDIPAIDGQGVPKQPSSPQRLPANLPDEPPGVSADGPISSAEPAYRLSGYTQATAANRQVNSPAKGSTTYRRPAGAWLFSRP
jgi:hypothetical protein